MMQAPQTQVPPELGALLTLVQGMQQGRVAPSTPEGQPTIAAQAMQAAQQQAQPDMQQAAQNAGIGQQQQMAQQQAAMQQLPQQVQQLAQRQQAMEQGIARAPGAGAVRMAGGGIVGFAGGGTPYTGLGEYGGMNEEQYADDEARRKALIKARYEATKDMYPDTARRMLLENPWLEEGGASAPVASMPGRERGQAGYAAAAPAPAAAPPQALPLAAPSGNRSATRSSVDISGPAGRMPPPPPGPQGPSAAAQMFEQGLGAINKMAAPATPEQELATFGTQRDARRTAMQQAGNDPDQVLKDIAASETRGAERAAHVAKLEGELAGRSKNAGLIEFLINARGNKGEGFGRPLATGAAASLEGDKGRRAESRTIAELKFAYQDAAVKEQAALRDAKLKTDMGDFEGAKKSMEEARAFANSKLAAESKLRGDRAGEMERSEQVDKQVAQQRYNTDVQAALEREKMKSNERIANIAATSRDGTKKNPYDVVNDNALKEFEVWSKLPANLMASEQMRKAKFKEFYDRNLTEAARFGLAVPAPIGGAQGGAAVAVPTGVTVKKIGP